MAVGAELTTYTKKSAVHIMQVFGMGYRKMLPLHEIHTTVQCSVVHGSAGHSSGLMSYQDSFIFLSRLLASGPLKLDLGMAVSKNHYRPNAITKS